MPGLLRLTHLPRNSRRVVKEKSIDIQLGRLGKTETAGKKASLYKMPENL